VNPSDVVLIAAADLIDQLKAKAALEAEPRTFADIQAAQALEVILRDPPRLVILERFFAATPRGTDLVGRLRREPSLAGVEIRVLAHDSDYAHVVPEPAAGPATVVDGEGPQTRGESRRRLRDGVEAQIDGKPVTLVDLSSGGAQVVSDAVLRPNQRVRISMVCGEHVVRVAASIAWAKFEMGGAGEGPRHRAGLEFVDADPAIIATLYEAER
jgi:hypothetical protein